MIAVEENQNDIVKTHSCFERTFASMTVDDVYEIAKVVGSEVEKLIDTYGKSSVEGLVSHIVKVLELLESFASRNQSHKCKEEELLKAFETLQLQQQKKRHVKDCEETSNCFESRVRARQHGRHANTVTVARLLFFKSLYGYFMDNGFIVMDKS